MSPSGSASSDELLRRLFLVVREPLAAVRFVTEPAFVGGIRRQGGECRCQGPFFKQSHARKMTRMLSPLTAVAARVCLAHKLHHYPIFTCSSASSPSVVSSSGISSSSDELAPAACFLPALEAVAPVPFARLPLNLDWVQDAQSAGKRELGKVGCGTCRQLGSCCGCVLTTHQNAVALAPPNAAAGLVSATRKKLGHLESAQRQACKQPRADHIDGLHQSYTVSMTSAAC